jgi:hypothetical protein
MYLITSVPLVPEQIMNSNREVFLDIYMPLLVLANEEQEALKPGALREGEVMVLYTPLCKSWEEFSQIKNHPLACTYLRLICRSINWFCGEENIINSFKDRP